MEFHGEFSIEIHGIPWNSMEVFHTGCSIKMSAFLQIPVLILDLLYVLKQGCNIYKEKLKKEIAVH